MAWSIPIAVWAPGEIPKLWAKNPFKEPVPDSPKLAAFKAKVAEMRFKAATGGV